MVEFNSVQFSHSVMSDSLQRHESQHARPPCASPTPRVYPNSCPLSRWCHPAISFSVVPFSSCPQSFPASRSFQMSHLFALSGQSTGVSASPSVLPMNTQDWFPLGWTGWTSLQSKGHSMDGGLWHCTGDREQDHPQEKEMQKSTNVLAHNILGKSFLSVFSRTSF